MTNIICIPNKSVKTRRFEHMTRVLDLKLIKESEHSNIFFVTEGHHGSKNTVLPTRCTFIWRCMILEKNEPIFRDTHPS